MTQVYKKLTRKTWFWLAIGVAGVLAAVAIAVVLSIPIRSGALKSRVIALLSDQLESEVTIERLEGRVFPRVSVSGGGVVIRQKGRTDVPPLIMIEEFEIHGSFREFADGTSPRLRSAAARPAGQYPSGWSRLEQRARGRSPETDPEARSGDHRAVRGAGHGYHAHPWQARQAAQGVHGPPSRDGSAWDQPAHALHRHADQPHPEGRD